VIQEGARRRGWCGDIANDLAVRTTGRGVTSIKKRIEKRLISYYLRQAVEKNATSDLFGSD
jgi:hypothetical protein